MSERNVEVVRSLLEPFQAINTAEIDWGADVVREALAAKCSPDIEVRTLDSGIGTGIDPGARQGSGARTELEMSYACEVKDGLITRILQYDTLEDARAAIAAGA